MESRNRNRWTDRGCSESGSLRRRLGRRSFVGVALSMCLAMPAQQAPVQKATAQQANAQLGEPTIGLEAPVSEAEFTAALLRFEKLSSRRQDEVIEAVVAAIAGVEDPWLEQVRALAALELPGEGGRHRRDPIREVARAGDDPSVGSGALAGMLPFPASVHYRYGLRRVDPFEVEPRDARGRRVSRSKAAELLRVARLESLCAGHAPDLDRALAALLARLDDQVGIDAEARFLERWRDGSESFYEALDRTAGRMEGVFHYDAMLDEWVRELVPKGHPDRTRLAGGIEASLHGFQTAFQAYRSYRSVREAVALSLLLDPRHDLPGRLVRFQENAAGADHSSRECVEVLLGAHGGDLLAAVDAFLAAAPELPEDMWCGEHRAWEGINAAFDQALQRVVDAGTHTSAVVERHRVARRAVQDRIAATARRALLGSL